MSNKNTKKVGQQQILESDVKSRRKTSIEEFALIKNLRPEVKAGFKAWLKGQYFHFDKEWETLYENYMNRQL